MEIKIVLGTLWGDEGKGNTVQWLCKKALEEGKRPCVVRFSGGPQVGHTVRHNGITHVCSSYGSGVLLGIPTLYTGGLIDPLCMWSEKKSLEEKGVKVPPIYIGDEIPLITPYDVADQLEWSKKHPNRTCGKGVMSAVLRQKTPLTYEHIEAADFWSKTYIEFKLEYIKKFYAKKEITADKKVIKDWKNAGLDLYKDFFHYNMEDFDILIFEGTQGLLLDSEHGFYPYVTSTKVGLNGIPEIYLRNAEVYFVTRTYLTRHGKMSPFDRKFIIGRKRNLDIPESKLETNTFNEFQGEFRVAPMDYQPIEVAIHRHRLDNFQKRYKMKFNLVVTHMDIPDLYPTTSTREVASALSMTLRSAGLRLSNVYGGYGPDSKFKPLYKYGN